MLNRLFRRACLLLPLLWIACGDPEPAPEPFAGCEAQEGTECIQIASELAPCTTIVETECMQIKHAGDEDWSLFYGEIEGFTWESGFVTVVRVRHEEIENPPQDASSVRTILVEVLSREPDRE